MHVGVQEGGPVASTAQTEQLKLNHMFNIIIWAAPDYAGSQIDRHSMVTAAGQVCTHARRRE